MTRCVSYLLVAALSLALGALVMNWHDASRHANEMAAQQDNWAKEKEELETALAQAKARATAKAETVTVQEAKPAVAAPARPSPAEIIARLQSLGPSAGSAALRMRTAVYWLEELVHCGPAALPAIREFLTRNEELEFDAGSLDSRAARDGKLPSDFALPPSLRLGLFEVTRRIGGADAEKVLAEVLGVTGRGVELAYVTRLLHEMSPYTYKEAALSAARTLLSSSAGLNSASSLDRNHRDYLFAVLAFYHDTFFVTEAQSQLVRTDNQIDRGALRYLQDALGARAVPVVAQIYDDPRFQTNATAKEPLARLALSFVGADPQADAFYEKTINDPVLTKSHRQNLIEDLNEDGLNFRNLTPNDLPMIENRIALIEQLASKAMDQANAEAFKEAHKDLVNMWTKIKAQKPPAR